MQDIVALAYGGSDFLIFFISIVSNMVCMCVVYRYRNLLEDNVIVSKEDYRPEDGIFRQANPFMSRRRIIYSFFIAHP